MGNLKLAGIGLLVLVAGYSIGRYATPPKVTEKIVTKEVEVQHKDVKTVTVEVDKPDGTKTITTTQQDNTVTDTTTTSKDTKITTNSKDWKVDVGTGYDFYQHKQIYMAQVGKRLIGGVFVGVFGSTNETAGVSVGVEF